MTRKNAGRCLPPIVAAITGLLAVAQRPSDAFPQQPEGVAAATALEDAFVKAIETAEKSVVSIARSKVQPAQRNAFQDNFGQGRGDRNDPVDDANWVPNEFGAGIIIDPDGLILTNYHLVRGGPAENRPDAFGEQVLYVRLPDRRGFRARIYAADPRSDLAVLKIEVKGLKAIKYGNAGQVRKGQMVIALGNPYAIARDGSASASWGIISNISRLAIPEGEAASAEKPMLRHLGTMLEIDTRLELGTSGGALINLNGELVGITTSLAAIVGYEKSAGFAFPIDDAAIRIIDTLRQGKEVEYGFLGIYPGDVSASDLADKLGAAAYNRIGQHGAARIDTVLPNLPGYHARLQPGDIVLRVNKRPILNHTDLMREITLIPPGKDADITIWRTTGESHVKASIGKWPVIDDEGIITSKPLREPWRGITYDYFTARQRYFKRPNQFDQRGAPPREGVLVLEVQSNSPAATEVQPGELITHVNRVPVRTPRDFADAVRAAEGDKKVELTVGPAGSRSMETRTVMIGPGK